MNTRESLVLDLARDLRDHLNSWAEDPSPRNDHEVESAVSSLLAAVDHAFPLTAVGAGKNNKGRGDAVPSKPVTLRPEQPGAALSIREGILALLADGRWWTTPELVEAIERGGRVRAKVNSMRVGTALVESMRCGLVQRQALEVARQGARFEWRAWA